MDSGNAHRPYERFRQLDKELAEAGLPDLVTPPYSTQHGVHALVNGLSSKPYLDILLRYLDDTDEEILEAVLRALTQKECSAAADRIIRLFDRAPRLGDNTLWIAGNALNVFNDLGTYPKALIIARRRELGYSRQMLMDLVARMRTEEAFNTLLELLTDASVVCHVMTALAKFNDVRAIEHIEAAEIPGSYDGVRSKVLQKLYRLKAREH